ncbi:outer membrane protein assembly factor BamA [Candidatus Fermentibacterales bacterium]|nr:outer membrane protein assembly factor BamA [Candidatus Fermentibacterales bacterium]
MIRALPILLIAASLSAPGGAQALPVGEVVVEGTTFVSDSLLIRTLGLSTGTAFSPLQIRSGVRALYSLGYFSAIEVLVDSSSGLANLTVSVVENRVLSDWRLENPGDLDDDDVREVLTLLPGQTVSLSDVEDAISSIVHLYREDHRHMAAVGFRWEEPDSDGRSELVFECDEGPDIRVGRIEFNGNTAFDDGKLRGRMSTHEDAFLRSGRLRESELSEDLRKIEEFYHDRGYPDARVTGVERSMLDDGRHLLIEILVDEGPYCSFGEIGFSGGRSLPDSVLRRTLEIRAGQEYSREELEKTLDNIYIQLHDRGYFYASVEADIRRSPDQAGLLDVEFTIEEGERASIRRIEIVGNTRTMDNVIRRELTVRPGDLFQRSKLVRSVRNIYYLNYFDDVVPDFRMLEGSSDIDLIMDVSEKSTGRAGVGVGYGEIDGLNGYLEFGESNLFGRGQSIGVNYQFSKRRHDVQLSFTEPWLRDTPLSLGGELFHMTLNRTEYDRKRVGAAVSVGRPLPWWDYTSASVRYLVERVDVYNITEDSTSFFYSLRDEDWPQWTSAIRLRLGRDSRDRQVFPGEGSVNSVTAEFAGGVLGGDIGYQKYLLDSSWYMTTFWRFIFMARVRAGYIAGLGGGILPAYELFELGGTGFYGVRGYPDRSIGAVEGFETVGGRSMLILTAEYRLRVIDQVQLAVFADAGNAWSSLAASDFSDLHRGAGLGIRVEVPMLGIIGLDYGYGFDGPDRGWEPHFQFGASF